MKMEKMAYEAPQIEIAEIAVEQGIATTGDDGSTAEPIDWKGEMGWE